MSRSTQGFQELLSIRGYHPLWPAFPCRSDRVSRNHWPDPLSLATTYGVSVDVLSSGYLDVSVHRVRLSWLCIHQKIPLAWWVAPFGNPWIKAHSQLPTAYRSVSRPSSPPDAKASTRCPSLAREIRRHVQNRTREHAPAILRSCHGVIDRFRRAATQLALHQTISSLHTVQRTCVPASPSRPVEYPDRKTDPDRIHLSMGGSKSYRFLRRDNRSCVLYSESGGPGWTRTTDLTLIRRVL